MNRTKDYLELCKIKTKKHITKYPYVSMNNELVITTLERIEIIYQNLSNGELDATKKKGGGGSSVTIYTM
jgi:hypothetical protein